MTIEIHPVDLSLIKTVPLLSCHRKSHSAFFADPPVVGGSFKDFYNSLPHILAGADIHDVVNAIVAARAADRPVVLAFGGHVIKCGLGPVIIDLISRGVITALATNGAGAIHDCEIAISGSTSEDVEAGLANGSFGMARETGEFFNNAINKVRVETHRGAGSLLGEALATTKNLFGISKSVIYIASDVGIPCTVHLAIGTDTVHAHPSSDGACLGQATHNDFRLLAGVVSKMAGGVYINAGSSVVLPEVFLKAFTIARNLGCDLTDLTTVNIDMSNHYRPAANVVRRPSAAIKGGHGYNLIGRHEILIPLLAWAVAEAMPKTGSGD